MKSFILSISLICIGFAGFGQDTKNSPNSFFGNTNLFRDVTFSNSIFEFGYLNSPVLGKNLSGFHFNFLAAFNQHFATGFGIDNLSTNTITYPNYTSAINPQFSYTVFKWRNEILIAENHKIGISIPIDIGIGYASYSDDYFQTANNSRIIADDHFFSGTAGLNINMNLFKHMGLTVGGRYRISSGVIKVGTDNDYSNYVLNATIRFRIFKDEFKDKHK